MERWTKLPKSFYRIIDSSVLRHHKLMMPDEFAQRYGGELSNFISITVPVGGIWRVGVERTGKMLWLHDGWRQFMEYYSMGFGHFLIFNYKGNSKFHVHIYDITATEIQYPLTTNARRPNYTTDSAVHGKEEFGVDNYNSMIDSPVLSPMLTSSELDALCENPDKEAQDGKTVFSQNRVEPTQGRKRACHATAFDPDNSSFMVTMKSYNVETTYVVPVPTRFVKEHLLNAGDYIELQDSDGKKWPVRCIRKGGKTSVLSKGWMAFSRAKELARGDICVFKLIPEKQAILKVSIIRAQNLNCE